MSHWNGFSPVWVLTWLSRWSLALKVFKQMWHLNLFSDVTFSILGNHETQSAKIQNQLTGASPSDKGIAKAFEDAKILTKENANAVFNKYRDYNRIKQSLNSLSQERKDAYLNKDYELPATVDDIDTIARQLIGE